MSKQKSIDYLVLAEPIKGVGHIARFASVFKQTSLRHRLKNLFFIGDESFLLKWLKYFSIGELSVIDLKKTSYKDYFFRNLITDCLCYEKHISNYKIHNLIAFEDFCDSNSNELVRINSFAGFNSPKTITLSGIEYEILRPDVKMISSKIEQFNIESRQNTLPENLKIGFIFGGTDPKGYSHYFEKKNKLNFHNLRSSNSFVESLSTFDVVFCSAGRTVLECIALGVIPLVFYQNERERGNHSELKKFIPEVFCHDEILNKDNNETINKIEEKVYKLNSQINLNNSFLTRRLNIYRKILASGTAIRFLEEIFETWES